MFKHMNKVLSLIAILSLVFVAACDQMAGDKTKKKGSSKTVDATKKAGFVKCGVSQGLPGFSNALEKPGSPCETPHLTNPAFFVASTVLDDPFFFVLSPAIWSQAATNTNDKIAIRDKTLFICLNIFILIIKFININSII